MIRMLPWFAEWMAHLSRMSGKSVTAKASRTPHDWFIGSPRSSRPIAARVPLREPSQPTTYFARIVDISPVSLNSLRCCKVTVTGYSDEPLVSIWMSLAWRP
jgi:hypothetical protein